MENRFLIMRFPLVDQNILYFILIASSANQQGKLLNKPGNWQKYALKWKK